MITFGEAGRETIDTLLTRIVPGRDLTAKLTCVPWQSPGVYNADTEVIPPYDTGLTSLPSAVVLEVVRVRSDESALHLDESSGQLFVRIIIEVVPITVENATIEAQVRDATSMLEPYHNAIIANQTPNSITIGEVAEGDTYDIRLRWRVSG